MQLQIYIVWWADKHVTLSVVNYIQDQELDSGYSADLKGTCGAK